IGYIHLVMLGVMTLGVLGWFASNELIEFGRLAKAGLLIFIAAFVLLELILFYPSPAGWFGWSPIPNTADIMLVLSGTMLIGTILICISSLKKSV
nr:hypothetical protein [Ignavibacteria bacterium]